MTLTRIFLDSEFTGLTSNADLISLALYIDDTCFFYSEFNDFDTQKLNPWVKDHVMIKLDFLETDELSEISEKIVRMKGSKENIVEQMIIWLKQFDVIEIWGDVPAYDWVLFCELFGGAQNIPENIFYAPFDLATIFRLNNLIKPVNNYNKDVSRFKYAGAEIKDQHHALEDARIEKDVLKS